MTKLKKKKPVRTSPKPGYPDLVEASMDRRRFLTVVGVGTVSLTTLHGCFGSSEPAESKGEEVDVTGVDTGHTAHGGRDPMLPGGVPRRPEFKTLRLPTLGTHVVRLKDGAEISYHLGIIHKGEELAIELSKDPSVVLKHVDEVLIENYTLGDMNKEATVYHAQEKIKAKLDEVLGPAFIKDAGSVELYYVRGQHRERKRLGTAMPSQ